MLLQDEDRGTMMFLNVISPEFLLSVQFLCFYLLSMTLAILLCASQVSCGIYPSLGVPDIFSHESTEVKVFLITVYDGVTTAAGYI